MSKRRFCNFLFCILILIGLVLIFHFTYDRKIIINNYTLTGQQVSIRPDYSDTVIPANIAPLNFCVEQKGVKYLVKIFSKNGPQIEVFSETGKIIIPEKRWHSLLQENKGQELCFDIFVQARNGIWEKFETITNTIAAEAIDEYLVFRKIHPTHTLVSGKVGIYQRNLSNYDESVVLENHSYIKKGCVNCHTFRDNRTDKMLIGIRSKKYGSTTALIEDGKVRNIGAKFGYSSLHPSGKVVAYSYNVVDQFFISDSIETRHAIDIDSALLYYLVDSEVIKLSPKLSKKDQLETYPAWSPDGKYLYFCRAPLFWQDKNKLPPENYKQLKYNLVRISYDVEKDQWGELETVLSAKDTNMSSLLPRISPDGRWLLLCMFDNGTFPAFEPESDLYMVDLATSGAYQARRLKINSDKSESWHSWSNNSRWVVFSSKRRNGVFTRPYFSYVNSDGEFSKPWLLPQKDPSFFDSCIKTYSAPELVTEPIRVSAAEIAGVIRSQEKTEVDMPITMATPEVSQYQGIE